MQGGIQVGQGRVIIALSRLLASNTVNCAAWIEAVAAQSMPTPIGRLESLGHFHCIEPVSGVTHAHFYCWSQAQKHSPYIDGQVQFRHFQFCADRVFNSDKTI